MTSADHNIVGQAGVVFAAGVDPAHVRQLSSAAETEGFRLRTFENAEAMRGQVAQIATGCIVLLLPNDREMAAALIRQVSAYFLHLSIVCLAREPTTQDVAAAMRLGAFTVVCDTCGPLPLIEALRAACAQSAERRLAADGSQNAVNRMQTATPKEREVLELILAGRRNKEIADILGITVRAIEDRRGRLMKKTGAESLAELIALAVMARQQTIARAGQWNGRTPPRVRRFVRGMEVWLPSRCGTRLRLHECNYRDAPDLTHASHDLTFAADEGLPGRVWQQQAPVFIPRLATSAFVRREAAQSDGVSMAVGFPVFAQGRSVAVVLLLLDHSDYMKGAIESWTWHTQNQAMELSGGVYASCDRLRRITAYTRFPLGHGLPGLAAAQSVPMIAARFAEDSAAARGVILAADGLVSGMGLRLADSGRQVDDVLWFFNSATTPLFRLLQVWSSTATAFNTPVPETRTALRFRDQWQLQSEWNDHTVEFSTRTRQRQIESAVIWPRDAQRSRLPRILTRAEITAARFTDEMPSDAELGLLLPASAGTLAVLID